MNEKELINKVKALRAVKPDHDWAVSLKSQLLAEERAYSFDLSLLWKPALATICSIFLLMNLLSFIENALPGDLLYVVKRLAERGQTYFVAEDAKPETNLRLVDKRLEELNRVAQNNQSRKLSQAINEFQASANQAAQDFKSPEMATSKTIEDMVKLAKDKQLVEETLATRIDTTELDHTYKDIAEYLIMDWETRTLTEEQVEVLNQMKELILEEAYGEALELYLFNQ